MEDSLAKRGHSLEEAFFFQRDAALIEQRKKIEEMAKNREALSEVSGIKNPEVLDKLIELEVSPSVLASLAVLPLVEVAWADGVLTDKEKEAVLAGAAKVGIVIGSVNYVLLEGWLKERPNPKFLKAWIHYIAGLRNVMTQEQLDVLKAELLNRARAVAEATGGIMGVIAKISPQEQAVLRKMEETFKLWAK